MMKQVVGHLLVLLPLVCYDEQQLILRRKNQYFVPIDIILFAIQNSFLLKKEHTYIHKLLQTQILFGPLFVFHKRLSTQKVSCLHYNRELEEQ